MASRTLPGMGLNGFWTYGEDGWNTGADENWRALSVMTHLSVKDKDLSSPPGSPSNGDLYIVGSSPAGGWAGQANKVAVHDNGAWVFLTASTGATAFVEDEQVYYHWNAAWKPLIAPVTFSAYCDYRFVLPTAGTWTTIPTNNARHNDQSAWSSSTGEFTAPYTGYYSFTGAWTFDDEGTVPSWLAVGLGVNAANPTSDSTRRYTATMTGTQVSLEVNNVLKLNENDTVKLMAYHSTNGAAVHANFNSFSGFRLT